MSLLFTVLAFSRNLIIFLNISFNFLHYAYDVINKYMYVYNAYDS